MREIPGLGVLYWLAGILYWLRRHRLERAKDLLHQTDETVLAVAAACGFQTSAHFVASFRVAFATTPARWRQALVTAGSASR